MHTRSGSAHSAHRHARSPCEETIRRLYTVGILLFALSVFVVPLISTAQPPGKVSRIGWLTLGFPAQPDLDGLRQGLRELGYIEGQNLVIEERYAEGKVERLSDFATRAGPTEYPGHDRRRKRRNPCRSTGHQHD